MKCHSETSFAKRHNFGCNSFGQGGQEQKQVSPKIVPFSASVLAMVTNKVETAISEQAGPKPEP